MNSILDLLFHAGFDEDEAKIYLLLNSIGSQAASTIAKRLGKNRITTFHMLKRMCTKGFLKEIPKRTGVHFTAIDIDHLIKQKRDERSSVVNNIEDIIENLCLLAPQLKQLSAQQYSPPTVEIYTGDYALKELYMHSFSTSKILAYFNPWSSKDYKRLRDIDDWHTQERVKKNIPAKILLPDSIEGKAFAEVKKPLKLCKLLEESLFPMKDLLIITDDATLMYSPEDNIAVAITSTNIAQTQQAIFSALWETTSSSKP